VTQAEFANVVDVYMAAANQRQREITQLHRYAVNASVYGLPFQFFVQQPERLQAVTLVDVNRFREQTLEQISKN
jgi:predicted Zn-dependent peptidase